MEEVRNALLALESVKAEKKAVYQGTGTTRENHADGTNSLMTEESKAMRDFWRDARVQEIDAALKRGGLSFNPYGLWDNIVLFLETERKADV